MKNWKRIPQANYDGEFCFRGKVLISLKIFNELSITDILFILRDVKSLVKEKEGIDKIQEYEDENGTKIFLEDKNINLPNSNFCTMRFSSEK